MDETVLAYIEIKGSYLMLYRNKKANDINEGKWVGIGGHLEKGETPEIALKREIKEETNLDVKKYRYVAKLLFINKDYKEIMHLYKVVEVEDTIKECDEGELRYIPKESMHLLNMWEGDKYFLDRLDDDYFELTLIYDGDKLIEVKEGIEI